MGYVLNQLAIQIGWLMGYFTHLENKSLKESQYFNYGLPLIGMFQEHVYRLMEAFATTEHAKENKQNAHNEESESLLSEIRHLSEKTYKGFFAGRYGISQSMPTTLYQPRLQTIN